MNTKEILSNTAFVDNNDFAKQMVLAVEKYGQLTKNQASALERCYKGFEKYQKIVAESQLRDSKSDHVGVVGHQLSVGATLESVFSFDGRFGPTNVFIFRTSDGDLVKWMTGSRGPEAFEKGARYIVTGSVKKHDEYRGAKQTILTRCTVERETLAHALAA